MFAHNIAVSTLLQEVLNKMKQNKSKSFSMNENDIIWKMFKLLNPKWGFTYPTGNISSWNLSKPKNLHDFAKCHCSSMCEEMVYFYWAQLTALSNLEALQKQRQNALQFEFLNYDTITTQFVFKEDKDFKEVKMCRDKEFFWVI